MKPPTFQNPFKVPLASSIFASGKSLFETSTLNQPKKDEDTKKEEVKDDDDEEEKLELDVKETVQQNSLFEKVFQR